MKTQLAKSEVEILERKENYVWLKVDFAPFGFSAKVYRLPSKYGIDHGCISKFFFWETTDSGDEQDIANYDRNWDILPKTDRDQEMVKNAIDFINSLSLFSGEA
jgi:hypothetical protein